MKKVLLIHGWNYRNYTKLTKEKDAWHDNEEFVKELSKDYEIYKINLPGFCSKREPNVPWHLENFADYIHDYLQRKKLNVDYILGYSFGGDIAISYYLKYHGNDKLILISPAIARDVDNINPLKGIRSKIKAFYKSHMVKPSEVRFGSPFLKGTYQIIVREDLQDELLKIPAKDMLLIYGSNDNIINPKKFLKSIPNDYKNRAVLIDKGNHNIGQSHPKEICEIIKKKI